jgi:hypothetical protein
MLELENVTTANSTPAECGTVTEMTNESTSGSWPWAGGQGHCK